MTYPAGGLSVLFSGAAMLAALSGLPAQAQSSAYGCAALDTASSLPSIEGENGVFYRVLADLRMRHPMEEAVIAQMSALSEALAEAGISIAAHAIADGPSSVSTGRHQTEQLCRMAQVDVAVYSNDDMAVGGVFYCMGAGIRLPDQLAIFGFNGLDIGRELPQPLSTVRSNRFLIGQKAIESILRAPERPATKTNIDTGFEIFAGATA